MSSVKVDEILDSTGSLIIPPSIPGLQPQLIQAWVNFDGTGVVSIRDSHNVSSITDNGTGNYNVNFTTALSNTDYACIVTGSGPSVTVGSPWGFVSEDTKTANEVRVALMYMGGGGSTYTNLDGAQVSVVIVGGQ